MNPGHRRGWAMGGGGEGRRARHSPLTSSLLEPALLILLKEQPRHGYTLLANLEAWGIRTIHPSIVYRTLREMEALQWIESDWETAQTQGPPRRTYHLTVQGEEALRNWQQELAKVRSLISQLLELL
ncbi:MAG: helix-turn-helix transcriptional regulator [Anaerolineaceae bacterium]|nr:helix-turn-helix transcriptional regulator [Anaerolineaceae bacterium]